MVIYKYEYKFTKKIFMFIEKWIGEWQQALLEDSMKDAGAAEKAITISGR